MQKGVAWVNVKESSHVMPLPPGPPSLFAAASYIKHQLTTLSFSAVHTPFVFGHSASAWVAGHSVSPSLLRARTEPAVVALSVREMARVSSQKGRSRG